MKNKAIAFLAAGAIFLGVASPSFAEGGALGSVGSFFGAVTATIIDIPEGMIIDSLYRSPKKTWHNLAEAFGDEKGFQQNVAGAAIGIPVGFAWGIPSGAIRGGKHGWGTGWEKPFSTESYIVSEDK